VTITEIALRKPTSKLIIIGVYRPPQASYQWFNKFNELLLRLLGSARLIVMGDLNVDLTHPDRI